MLVDDTRSIQAVQDTLHGAVLDGLNIDPDGEILIVRLTAIRAVPDRAEEYWVGPLHRTRVPWTRCVLELRGVHACSVVEDIESPPTESNLILWSREDQRFRVDIVTPWRTRMTVLMDDFNGTFQDTGELMWDK